MRIDRVIGYAYRRHARLIWRRAKGLFNMSGHGWMTGMVVRTIRMNMVLGHALAWPLTPLYEIVRTRHNARSATRHEIRLTQKLAGLDEPGRKVMAVEISQRLRLCPGHPAYSRMMTVLLHGQARLPNLSRKNRNE